MQTFLWHPLTPKCTWPSQNKSKKTLRKYWENFFRNYALFYMQGVGILMEITVLGHFWHHDKRTNKQTTGWSESKPALDQCDKAVFCNTKAADISPHLIYIVSQVSEKVERGRSSRCSHSTLWSGWLPKFAPPLIILTIVMAIWTLILILGGSLLWQRHKLCTRLPLVGCVSVFIFDILCNRPGTSPRCPPWQEDNWRWRSPPPIWSPRGLPRGSTPWTPRWCSPRIIERIQI